MLCFLAFPGNCAILKYLAVVNHLKEIAGIFGHVCYYFESLTKRVNSPLMVNIYCKSYILASA